MPARQTLDAFIARVLSGDHAGAIEDFYAEDASMQENLDPPRVGRDKLVAGERATLARFAEVRTELIGPPMHEGDVVMINWAFEFVDANGKVARMEEIARQQWRGEKILCERFFYDPKQMRP